MPHKHSLIRLVIVITGGLLTWAVFFIAQSTTQTVSASSPNIDTFMENVTAVVLDQQGNPRLKLVTPKMIHYPANDTTEMVAPEFDLYRHSPQPWHINAKHGKAQQGIEKIDLWDEVVIHHPADIQHPSTLIQTPALTIYPSQQTAETKEAITIQQPNLIVHAIGMKADLNTDTLQLLSQAKGEYEPG